MGAGGWRGFFDTDSDTDPDAEVGGERMLRVGRRGLHGREKTGSTGNGI
jgi:hypothetical protein